LWNKLKTKSYSLVSQQHANQLKSMRHSEWHDSLRSDNYYIGCRYGQHISKVLQTRLSW